MTLKVLVDNNTYIDQYYLGEPAVCFYLEDENHKILFDTGYSDILITNAFKMGIDLNAIDTIVFSHGHNDHTAGFQYLCEKFDTSKMKVVAHPLCFNPRKDGDELIGAVYDTDKMKELSILNLSAKPIKISKNITFLGEIPKSNDFEIRKSIGNYQDGNKWLCDYVIDDTALAVHDEDGIFIITGCSHSGICNIIEYAKNVCKNDVIKGVIGGFHLFEKDEILEKTIDYFKRNNIPYLYPCHCVSFQVKARMNEVINVKEVGVSLTITL